MLMKGSSGEAVVQWQQFLRGLELFMHPCLGLFDDNTDAATRAFQAREGCQVDGKVGNETYGVAMGRGLCLVTSDSPDETGPNWPPPPKGLRKMRPEERPAILGRIAYRHKPVKGNPEGVELTNSWKKDNIVRAYIPQLAQIKGIWHRGRLYGKGPADGVVWCHRLFVDPLSDTFAEWGEAGLLPGLLTHDGLLAIRFIRGSRTYLSNHCYGSAIDLNAGWNGLRCRPALVGQRGTLRKHVEIANNNGLWWLGHTFYDGMHFELGVKR